MGAGIIQEEAAECMPWLKQGCLGLAACFPRSQAWEAPFLLLLGAWKTDCGRDKSGLVLFVPRSPWY